MGLTDDSVTIVCQLMDGLVDITGMLSEATENVWLHKLYNQLYWLFEVLCQYFIRRLHRIICDVVVGL